MGDILIDPIWQVLAVILSIIAIFVVIGIYLLSRKIKALTYQVLTNNPVLLKGKEIKGKLEILFNGEPVENVYLTMIKLINSGNTPIETKDYEDIIFFDFGEDAKVLTTEVAETKPESIKVTPLIIDHRVTLSRVLLNKNDSVTLKIIVSHYTGGKITVGGRIVGVKEIKELTKGITSFIITLSGIILFFIGNGILLSKISYSLFGLGLSFIGAILMFIFLIKMLIDIIK